MKLFKKSTLALAMTAAIYSNTNRGFFKMEKSAIISNDRKHRYELTRVWNVLKPCLMIVGLNPSTADENEDDPTIRRCIGFAKAWGYGSIIMTNLYAYRETNPYNMFNAFNPIGDDNNNHLERTAKRASMILVAWGANIKIPSMRVNEVLDILRGENSERKDKIKCLGKTKDGHPKHPLYIKADTQPIDYFEFNTCLNNKN